jgi:hypothetical protein
MHTSFPEHVLPVQPISSSLIVPSSSSLSSSSLAKQTFFLATAFLRRFRQNYLGFTSMGFAKIIFFYRAMSSAFYPTPNLEDKVSVLMSPSDRVAYSYSQALGSSFISF